VAGAGPIYGETYELRPQDGRGVYVEDVREVVLDADGAEVVSSTRVAMNFEDAPPEKSLITVWLGTEFEREAMAVKVSRHAHPNWPGYAEVRLT
jgi:hypothetical protein